MTPLTFDDFMRRIPHDRKLDKPTKGDCDGCGAKGTIYTTSPPHCLACLKYEWGYDQAHEETARELIRAIVRAALEPELPLPPRLIQDIVQEEIDAHYERQIRRAASMTPEQMLARRGEARKAVR